MPDEIPVTRPDVIITVAAETFPLDHTPPGVVDARVIVLPTQTVDGPVIDDGVALIVTVPVTAH